MSKDLTEVWKKGELEKGKKYWCKLQDRTSEICYLWLQTNHFTYLAGYQSTCLPDEYILEVLAPVPSYEEWEQLQNWADFTNDYHELREKLEIAEYKNAQLKELLEDSKFMLREMGDVNNWFEGDDCEPNYYMATECEKYADKINEVLK